jgi:hypothetical protein
MGRVRFPPRHGSSRALFVYGGAQRGISIAKVDFVGESTQIHLAIWRWNKLLYISTLHDQFFVPLDFL